MSGDARIDRGTRAMLALRAERLAAGERPLGWKVGFGAPAALQRLGTDRPLVGFLAASGRLADGATASLAGWANPMLEAEVAVVVGQGFAPAIELADVDPPPDDVERILAGNIYYRHVVLGPVSPHADGLSARLLRDAEELAGTDAPSALTGELDDVMRLTRELLEAHGEQLRPGDVVITGSIFPPVPIAPGQRYEAQLPPLGSVSVVLA
jgi:2-keto-4-pentenoate hydratase